MSVSDSLFFFFFFNLPSFEPCNYIVKSVSQMMFMMISLIAERIVESMCVVLCMIAFYFRLPAKSLRTYLLSEATSSRCCADTRHEVLVEACSRFGGSRMHHRREESKSTDVRARVRSPNGQPAFRNDTCALFHLMCQGL